MQQKPQPPVQQKPAPQKQQVSGGSAAVPEGVDGPSLADPHQMDNMYCVNYLNLIIPGLDKAVKTAIANEERPDPKTRALMMDCKKRKMQIENMINQGQLSLEDYIGKLKMQKVKDVKMYNYFAANGDQAKAKICKDRLGAINEELAGAE